jgi:hypothetical protein
MLKKMVFERLNSGGVKLGSQETRNAVYGGALNTLCLALSENENFRRMWGIPLDPSPEEKEADEESEDAVDEPTKAGTRMFEKMEDVELVLRFFAYRQIDEFKAGLNKISEFLDLFIVRGNNFPAAAPRGVQGRCSSRPFRSCGTSSGPKPSPCSGSPSAAHQDRLRPADVRGEQRGGRPASSEAHREQGSPAGRAWRPCTRRSTTFSPGVARTSSTRRTGTVA